MKKNITAKTENEKNTNYGHILMCSISQKVSYKGSFYGLSLPVVKKFIFRRLLPKFPLLLLFLTSFKPLILFDIIIF